MIQPITTGVSLSIHESGSGPLSLVFLHYFGGSALAWDTVINNLSDRYYCVAIDLRGFGDSIPAAGFSRQTTFSVDDMADDVADVIGQYVPGDYILVGHSMGGKVALALAAGSPERPKPIGLQSLVLISPSPPVPEPISDGNRQKLLMAYGQRMEAERTFDNITEVVVSKAVREQIITDNLRTAEPAWMAWLLAGSREDILSRMATVQLPVHIIVGADDRAIPAEVQQRLVLPYLKQATVEIILGAGHLLPLETPTELTAFILRMAASD